MSMVKLINSGELPDSFESQTTVIEDPALFTKQASAAGIFDYDALKPDDNHVGIHLVALGATESYGLNRNGDSFPKEACVKYHDTFVKHGHVYEHHINAKPEKARGFIKASAWNPDMQRIELFIHADKEKAKTNLEKMAKDGSHPYSMACKVPGDRCTICNQFRKSAADKNQCSHVKHSLGKLAEDGSIVGTHNDDPRFFDISFVFRPADRIAWDVKVASALGDVVDSVKLAELEGVLEPLAFASASVLSKQAVATKLASMEQEYNRVLAQQPISGWDHQLYNIAKSANDAILTEETIDRLRQFDPQDAFYTLANNDVIMNVDDYCKYAMGLDYGDLKDHMTEVKANVATIFTDVKEAGSLMDICNDDIYNIDTGSDVLRKAHTDITSAVKTASYEVTAMNARAIGFITAGNELRLVKQAANKEGIGYAVAKKYAAYKVAAINAMQDLGRPVDDRQYALAIAQNKITIN